MTSVNNSYQMTRRAQAAARRVQVAEMLLAKVPQRTIAARLGVNVGTICDDVREIKKTWRERAGDSYAAHVAEEVAKLDVLEQSLLPKVVDGSIAATEAFIRIMERRARLLGLDAPVTTKVELITEDMVDAEIKRLEAALAATDADAG